MVAIKEHLAKNDLGHVSSRLEEAVRMLEKMGDHQSACLAALDRVSNLVRSIADDMQQTNSELAHEKIQGKLHRLDDLVRDVKRIVLSDK